MQSIKKAKLEFLNNFDSSWRSKPFWVKCKPYFSNKHSKEDTDIKKSVDESIDECRQM